VFATIADQRRFGARLLVGALWLLVVLIAAVTAIIGRGALALGLGAIVFAAATTLAWRMDASGRATPLVGAIALMGQVSLLVAAFSASPWQTDMHMAYFAALAVLIIFCDWQVIAVGAAVVAAHHLMLNLVLPAAVFPGGGNIGRVLVHAVILIIEAAALMWASLNINRMFKRSSEALAAAEQAQEKTEMAMDAAARAREAEIAATESNNAVRLASEQKRAAVMAELERGLERLSAGDLIYRITQAFPAEYEVLRIDYNAAIDRLERVLTDVSQAAGAIQGGAGEISRASDDLSRRTEQQAASLEETAAAMDEITATVKVTASGAESAARAVQEARSDAQASGEVVRDAVEAMGKIKNSSQEISQIIGVIDEIAFQTNLLALNAGVEAARAGDSGRGFAVVAQEVRALAQRSADAAKQIKTLIAASATQVGAGVDLVGKTGEALQRIVARVAEIDGMVGASPPASPRSIWRSIRWIRSPSRTPPWWNRPPPPAMRWRARPGVWPTRFPTSASAAPWRGPLSGQGAASGRQPVTAGLGQEQLGAVGVRLNLLAQAIDMGFQGVGGDAGVVAPDLGQQFLPRDRLFSGAVEIFQDAGFLLRQPHLVLAIIDQQLGSGSKFVGADPEDRVLRLFMASQLGANSREQDREPKGLGDIVVGPGVEPADGVGVAAGGGEHNDGRGYARRADLTADLAAVHIRQVDVQEN
jgi:methyl-accepting chemotaxis protein